MIDLNELKRLAGLVTPETDPGSYAHARIGIAKLCFDHLPELIAALEAAALVRSVPQILPAAKLDEVAASAVDWDGSDIPENEPAKWETEAGVIRDMVAEIRAYRAIIAALPKETDNG